MATTESSIFPSVRYDVIYVQSIMGGESVLLVSSM